jgi:hypothetical protein
MGIDGVLNKAKLENNHDFIFSANQINCSRTSDKPLF